MRLLRTISMVAVMATSAPLSVRGGVVCFGESGEIRVNTSLPTVVSNALTICVSPWGDGEEVIVDIDGVCAFSNTNQSEMAFQWWPQAPGNHTLMCMFGTNVLSVTLNATIGYDLTTVTFDANGGSVSPPTRTVPQGFAVGTLPMPMREGYDFSGWWTAASGGMQVSALTIMTEDVTYYAHWTKKTHIVTLDANGGYGGTSVTRTYGTILGTLPTPTREGFTFDGWFTLATGGTQVSVLTIVTEDVTYYAHWTMRSYVVTLDANGGYGGTTVTRTYGTTLGTLPTLTREGYTFVGWWTTAIGGTEVSASTVVIDDVTYYAHWDVNCIVTFDASGGLGGTTITQTIGTAVGTLPMPTREGYDFCGWWTAVNGGNQVSASTLVTGDVIYYAHWAVRCHVIFDPNGGSGGMTNIVSAGVSLGNLPIPSREGHTFAGWWTAATGGREVSAMSILTNDVTYYAHWTEVAGQTYCVIDLSAGAHAPCYPVSCLADVPSGGWTEEYKTTKLVLRRIEPGKFMMCGHYNVTLTKPFYIGVFEVTQKQYKLVMGSNPSWYGGDMQPVENVSWNTIRGDSAAWNWPESTNVDSNSFVGRLQARTGLNFDLPTDAQWEYACRAGTTSKYNNGGDTEDDLKLLGRYDGNTDDGKSGDSHVTVGSYQPNAWGLYDMHGNVFEWCLDWNGELVNGVTDPVGSSTASCRVTRGGCWIADAEGCTSHARGNSDPWYSTYILGFRLASTLSQGCPLPLVIASFDANGGIGGATRTVVAGGPLRMLPTIPARDGYTFAGWWTMEDGGTEVLASTVVTSNVTYYAHWTETRSLTYCVIDLSAGANALSYPISYLADIPSEGWTDEFKTTKLVLRRIEPGSFMMLGQYNVMLTKPFYIGVFEVTQKQYELVMGGNPSTHKGDMRPVETISWNGIRGDSSIYNWPNSNVVDPNSFIGKIQERTGVSFDLPTEAQWEYACRAGTTSTYNNGGDTEDDLKLLGRYWDNGGNRGERAVVGSYLPNAWGLFDMHGNVAELCLNWSDWDEVLSKGVDPSGPSSSEYGDRRVRRGGHWASGAEGCASSQRSSAYPSVEDKHDGFRLARTMSEVFVTFDTNGGTDKTAVTRILGSTLGTLPIPTCHGYTFAGWWTEATGGTEVTASTSVIGDVTYYAHWAANSYSIVYDPNGGCGTMEATPATYDSEVTIAANDFIRVGYKFTGWTTNMVGEAIYMAGQPVTNLTAQAGGMVTLYAVWEEILGPDPIPEISETSNVAGALAGAADTRLADHITTATEYNAFRGWVDAKGLDHQIVKSSSRAWLSYALDASGLIERVFQDGDLSIVSVEPVSGGAFAFEVNIAGVMIGSAATAENLARLFSVGASDSLDKGTFSTGCMTVSLGVSSNGNLSVVATPRSAGERFFFRVRMHVEADDEAWPEEVVPTYCIIDLSAGANAARYPVNYMIVPPSDGFNTDEYKTTKLVLRRIAPGAFMMLGQYNITLTKPFYIGVFEVTQKQYELVTGSNPSWYLGDMRPVESTSWNTIRGDSVTYNWPSSANVNTNSFIGRLQTRTGLNFDLPTDAQWEYACRAGTTSKYNNGGDTEDDLKLLGRYKSNTNDGKGGYSQHTTVGSYLPNAWGLYDMHGNVYEWCLDWNGDMVSGMTDPVGSYTESCRVTRGGCYIDNYEGGCSSSARGNSDPWYSTKILGFRLARTLSGPEVVTHKKVQLWAGGPYWATTNIGAEEPWEYGYYFWWGDTVGYKYKNDAWVASDGSSSNYSFSSTNTPTFGKDIAALQSEGWITAENVLAPDHDAAHVQWGGGWRMPTDQELGGLFGCDWTWTTTNGVNGYVVRGRGDYASASIFLPCAGAGSGTSLYGAGSYGDYWSSVPGWGNAGFLYFYLSGFDTLGSDCNNGHSVRPVQGFTE